MNDIRMIAMDLDGTLVQPNGQILPRTLAALREASARGIILVPTSGRFPENAALVLLDHGLTGPVIGANGAMLAESPMGSLYSVHLMADETARRVRHLLDQYETDYFIFSRKLVVTSQPNLQHHSEISDGERISRLGGVRYAHGPSAVDEALKAGVCKFYVCDNGRLDAFGAELANVPGVYVTRSSAHNIELMPAGIDKGSGLRELTRKMNIPMSAVMAFGDEENDLPMLTQVGWGCAMGNAAEHIRSRCAHVTEPFDQDGIAIAIERYVLEG